MRGQQLGRACRAIVQPMASREECRDADAIVVVKRVPPALLETLRTSGKPWALDVVDFYPQPACALWDRKQSIQWVRQQIKALNPTAVIWPTVRMQDDCADARPSLVLPHHHRSGITRNPIRETIQTVGYEGRSAYLGGWEAVIRRECVRRGWLFNLTPASLSGLDVVVAVRGDRWHSYAARHWKSNVKLANAHASGTPFIGNPEWGYMETGTGCEFWVDTGTQLAEAFDRLEPQATRQRIAERFRAKAREFTVERMAEDLCRFLANL